ncbi:MAG: enoyl-CoA hydratase/isomerase family protein [Bdellovibrionales bacterium]|nr:enoyl-CoA hydratase/isomerase family protein [Bdellovibrionales bacterium]
MSKTYTMIQVSRNSTHPSVLEVKLNRPEIRNAFNEAMIEELTHVFQKEVLDESVRIVVLSGSGSHFSAGGDLNWMKKSVEMDHAGNLADTRRLSRMFASMNECPKPLIGVVHGAAIGGGVGMVSVCDIVIATEDTQFSLSEVRLGIIPACIGPFVVAKIGASHARGLFISAERFTAKRALEIGLIHEMVSDQAGLKTALDRLLGNMTQCGPKAMAAAKRLVLELSWPEKRSKHPDPIEFVSQMLAEIRVSDEGQEGLKAFLEKRKPGWLGGAK